jgi:hypothetical protein
MATEPVNTSRREGAFLDQPTVFVSEPSVCFTIAGSFMDETLIHCATAAVAWGRDRKDGNAWLGWKSFSDLDLNQLRQGHSLSLAMDCLIQIKADERSWRMMPVAKSNEARLRNQRDLSMEEGHLQYFHSSELKETLRTDDQAVDQKADRHHRRRFDHPHGSDVCAVDGDGWPSRPPAR